MLLLGCVPAVHMLLHEGDRFVIALELFVQPPFKIIVRIGLFDVAAAMGISRLFMALTSFAAT